MSANKNIIAYTDGSFRKELNLGGWSAVIINDNKTSEFCQGGFATDLSAVELKAIVLALENTPINSNVTIYSDAKTLIDVIQSRILSNENNSILPLKNRNLWEYLSEVMRKRTVSCIWIKGHSGIEGNERANQLAHQAFLEFENGNYNNKKILKLLIAQLPSKYKAKKSLLMRLDGTINTAAEVKNDENLMARLQEKKKWLVNAIIKHETLICKCDPEFKQKHCEKAQNAELPKMKDIKCLYCNKLFKTGSHCDQHIKDAHQNAEAAKGYPEYFICCYSGIKLLIE
ncbi:MAG: RNase H family protein [Methanosarcina sp.]